MIGVGIHEFVALISAIFHGSVSPNQFGIMQVWIAAICTIGIYTLLYRENAVYRVFEYLFLGVAAAYGFLRLYQDSLMNMWWGPMKDGQWWWIVPFLFGLLYFTIYFDKLAWMARTLIGTLMGLVAGYQFQQIVITYLPQVTDSLRPLTPGSVAAAHALTNTPMILSPRVEAADNIVIFVTIIAVMTYFFFSFEHKNKAIVGTAKLGRWLLMISFGTMFGSTITARVALAVSRIMYVLGDWLHLIKT